MKPRSRREEKTNSSGWGMGSWAAGESGPRGASKKCNSEEGWEGWIGACMDACYVCCSAPS